MERKEAVERVKELQSLLPLDKTYTLKFSKFDFKGITISEIRLAKVTTLTNKPEKRLKGEKHVSPFIVEVVTSDGTLQFVIEDTEWYGIAGGVLFKQANMEVRLYDSTSTSR